MLRLPSGLRGNIPLVSLGIIRAPQWMRYRSRWSVWSEARVLSRHSSTRSWNVHQTLEVRKMSLRSTPESLMPCPTSSSFCCSALCLLQGEISTYAVDKSPINVLVPRLQRMRDRTSHLSRLGLPCPEADGGDGGASVELEFSRSGHFVLYVLWLRR